MAPADAREKILVIESSQGHFRFPGKAGHGRDRGKVIASNTRQFFDEVNEVGYIELIYARGALLNERLIVWQESRAPLTHEQFDTEPCGKGHRHGHPARMDQRLRQCIAQEPPEDAGGTRREKAERAEVPAIDDHVHRLRSRDAGKLPGDSTEPFLYPR